MALNNTDAIGGSNTLTGMLEEYYGAPECSADRIATDIEIGRIKGIFKKWLLAQYVDNELPVHTVTASVITTLITDIDK